MDSQCALVRNLKMLKGTGFTSNLIQKLRRGCVRVRVRVCVRTRVCTHVRLLSRVRLFATPWSVACQAPLSRGFFLVRILEWVAISFARGSSRPRDQTWVSCTVGRFVTGWATRETPEEGEQEKTPWRKITGEVEWAGLLDSDRHGL